MLWKCMVSASNHCEVGRQRSLTQDLFNAIIYSAGRGRPWITGTCVCSNSIESATPTNRKLHWLDSWALWVFDVCFRRRCTSAHFSPPAVTGGRERELVEVERDLRLYILMFTGGGSEWERWAIWKSNCKNRFLENFIDNITILLNYYVRYFSSASGNPGACGLLFVNSDCWPTQGFLLTFLHVQIKSTTNVVSSCKLQHAYYYQLSVASTVSAVSKVAVLHRCYAGVFAISLVFPLHMIKIWNHKNWNRTMNRGFFS